MLKKAFFLLYAIAGYTAGSAALFYIIGFLVDFGVPKSIMDGTSSSLSRSILVDSGLIAAFGLHHSITARAWFKRLWTRIVPPPIERSTYLIMTAVMTTILVVHWQPIPITIWRVDAPWATNSIYTVYGLVWIMMTAATFHFGYFSFFGLTQAWRRLREQPAPSGQFGARYLYALVRHPISLGWMIAPWIVPHLTLGHVVFAVSTAAYILAATPFEEADLIADLGDQYSEYRKRVPAFLPTLY